MNKAIDAIGRLENLANKSSYEYTAEQVEEVKQKFTPAKGNAAFSFGNMTETEEK